ncbi:hypothetical protein [Prescottella equi]|uniref:hypothetical protein n=1 Tax=Rhodococcus hoagii TaxID=43767 RepID=UPI000A9F1C08|nr:hypothetical protein [Prescottella equi]
MTIEKQLEKLIRDIDETTDGLGEWHDATEYLEWVCKEVQGILKASRPRVVETVEELRTLPQGSVVMWDDYGNQAVAIIGEEGCIGHTANDYWNSQMDRIGLPATVIHMPEETP